MHYWNKAISNQEKIWKLFRCKIGRFFWKNNYNLLNINGEFKIRYPVRTA